MHPFKALWALFLLGFVDARSCSPDEQLDSLSAEGSNLHIRQDSSKSCSRVGLLKARDEDILSYYSDHVGFNSSQYITVTEQDKGQETIEERSIVKRAPGVRKPDRLPNRPGSAAAALTAASSRYRHAEATNENLRIDVNNNIVRQWVVDGMVVSATSEYHPWDLTGTKRQTWKMSGLEGCTGTLIFNEEGFWASHLWEHGGSVRANGVDIKEGSGAFQMEDHSERPDDRFKRIGADVHVEVTQPPISTSGHYLSLRDLQILKGNPFKNPSSVKILIMTPAKNKDEPNTARYDTKIKLLLDAYQTVIPGIPEANIKVRKYVTHYDLEEEFVDEKHGFLSLEFTAYQKTAPGTNGCGKVALARAWVEAGRKEEFELEFVHEV